MVDGLGLIEIRVLGPGDESLLERVAPGVFDDPIYPPATRQFLIDDRHHLVVALQAGSVVGFASAVHYIHPDKTHPELWINEVGVAPTHQGRGIGKAILRKTLEVARQLGCQEAWVLTERDNLPALGLYHALGGEEEESVMLTFRLA